MAYHYSHAALSSDHSSLVSDTIAASIATSALTSPKAGSTARTRKFDPRPPASKAKRSSVPVRSLYHIRTTLHPWPLEGPYSLSLSEQVWYCDNRDCKHTTHGVYAKYTIPCWRSTREGTGFVLCDGCVRRYNAAASPSPASSGVASAALVSRVPPTVTHHSSHHILPRPKSSSMIATRIDPLVPTTAVISSSAAVPSSSTVMLSGGVLKKGWMIKQGGMIKSWKKRFFLLRDDLTLTYYENDSLKSAKGSISLDTLKLIKQEEEQVLELECTGRTWRFVCKNSESRDSWIRSITLLTGATVVEKKSG